MKVIFCLTGTFGFFAPLSGRFSVERLRAPLRSGGGAAGARSAPGRQLLAGGLVWRPFGPPNRRPPVDVANPRPPGGKWGPNESGRTPGEAPSYRATQPGPANLCLGAAGCPRHRRAPLRSGGGGGGRAQRAWPPAFGRRPSLAARWAAKPPPPPWTQRPTLPAHAR